MGVNGCSPGVAGPVGRMPPGDPLPGAPASRQPSPARRVRLVQAGARAPAWTDTDYLTFHVNVIGPVWPGGAGRLAARFRGTGIACAHRNYVIHSLSPHFGRSCASRSRGWRRSVPANDCSRTAPGANFDAMTRDPAIVCQRTS